MAITGTTLSAAITKDDLIWPVTAATGFATSTTAPQWVKCDNEYAVVHPSYAGSTSLNIPVYRRGNEGGGPAIAHNALAAVTTGLFSDLPNLTPATNSPQASFMGLFDTIVEYSVSGAIAVPTQHTMVVLSKAGVAVMTLAAPSKASDGIVLWVTSNTAQAHTITATSLIADGASGSPHTTITFTTGYKGQGICLVAYQGLWQVFSNTATTIT